MSKIQTMTVEEIAKCVKPAFILRTWSSINGSITEYANLMTEKATFPPVVIGVYKGMENGKAIEQRLLVDGFLRIRAAQSLGLKSFPAELVEYKDENAALADMLNRNHGRGKDVTPGERNSRVILLVVQRGMKQKDVAVMVNLTPASISRILSGNQGDSKDGKQAQGHTFATRAKRGSKSKATPAPQSAPIIATGSGSQVSITGLLTGLKAMPAAVLNNAVEIASKTPRAQYQEVLVAIEEAMTALKGLHADLIKSWHYSAQRKKAA